DKEIVWIVSPRSNRLIVTSHDLTVDTPRRQAYLSRALSSHSCWDAPPNNNSKRRILTSPLTPNQRRNSAMQVRDIFLKIETITDYSPVSPDKEVSPPIVYERDCMRNVGHENGIIPPDEVNARRLTALVY